MNAPKNSNISVLLYDGHCPFCTRQAKNLKNWAGKLLQIESFQDPDILILYSKISYDDFMKEIRLVTPEGSVLGGARAIFYALSLKPFFGILRRLYSLPLFKEAADFVYAAIAKNRYKLQAKKCPAGSCQLHLSNYEMRDPKIEK